MENKNKKTSWEDFEPQDSFNYYPKDVTRGIFGECIIDGFDDEYIHYSNIRHFRMKKEDFNNNILKEEIMVCNCSDKDDD